MNFAVPQNVPRCEATFLVPFLIFNHYVEGPTKEKFCRQGKGSQVFCSLGLPFTAKVSTTIFMITLILRPVCQNIIHIIIHFHS